MRDAALWVAGAALAFVVTAGAFLILANLATDSSAENVPPTPAQGKPGPALDLTMGRLTALEPRAGQEFLLTVKNAGGSKLASVNLTLATSTGDTSDPGSRYYRRTVRNLGAGEDTEVRFLIDLSGSGASTSPTSLQEPSRILEVRATTPEGVTAVKTAVVPM